MNTRKKVILTICIFTMSLISVNTAHSGIVFQDSFDDANLPSWTAIESAWLREGEPDDPEPGIDSNSLVAHSPYLHLPYRTIKASLSETISTFKVRWKWLPKRWLQQGILAVANSTGTQGYVVRWNGLSDDSSGHVAILKFDDPNEMNRGIIVANATMISPYSDYISGRSIDLPFADFEFDLDSAGNLTVRVTDPNHGVYDFTGTDTSFTSFSRIYLAGIIDDTSFGNGIYVDELKVFPYQPINCDEVYAGEYESGADLNGDCVIDFEDFAELLSDWAQCNQPGDSNCVETW